MLKVANWPIGIEKRWVATNFWQRINRLYLVGLLKSTPSDGRHLVFTLDSYESLKGLEAIPWFESFKQTQKCLAIIAYDVLDHLPSEDHVVEFLKACESILHEDGLMYIMCHPWKSRLGNHLFDKNKAYIHLIKKTNGVHTLKIDKPLEFYRKKILEAGLKINIENVYEEHIESFFDIYKLDSQSQIQFVEYFVSK